MPRKDTYHKAVRTALIKDGWSITHDPLTLSYGDRDTFVDLGSERVLGAEKGPQKIAVEVKGFHGPSDMHDLEVAVGQYLIYRSLLIRLEADRKLYLAVPASVVGTLFEEPIVRITLSDHNILVASFDPLAEEIVQWTS